MNSDEEWVTAGELMDRLNADPVYQQRMLEKRKRRRKRRERIDADAVDLIADLRAIGCYQSLDEMVNSPSKLSTDVVEVLLNHVNKCQVNANREGIIRSLAGAEERFDGTPLTKCYEETKDSEGVRWAILNTIALVRPTGIDDWIRKITQSVHVKKTLINLGYPLDTVP